MTTRQKFKHEYIAWLNMKQRCYNPNRPDFKYYGGKGIKICKKWINSFFNFLKDMGEKPSTTHSLDRINGEKNYTPKNCRWATNLQQHRNKNWELVRLRMLGNKHLLGHKHSQETKDKISQSGQGIKKHFSKKYLKELRKRMMGNTYHLKRKWPCNF